MISKVRSAPIALVQIGLPSEVRPRDRPETLLPSLVTRVYRVPDLQFDGLALASNSLRAELDTDGRIVFLLEFVFRELHHQTALAHIWIRASYSTRQ